MRAGGGKGECCWTDLEGLAAVVQSLQVFLHLDSALRKPLPLHPAFQPPRQESYRINQKTQVVNKKGSRQRTLRSQGAKPICMQVPLAVWDAQNGRQQPASKGWPVVQSGWKMVPDWAVVAADRVEANPPVE